MDFLLEHIASTLLYELDPWDTEKKQVLLEKHGYLDNIDPILDRIWIKVINSGKSEGTLDLSQFNVPFISTGVLEYDIEASVAFHGYSPDQVEVKNGKAVNELIGVEVYGPNKVVREKRFKSCLSHELLHQYELVERVLSNREPDYVKQRMYYRDAMDYLSHPNKYFQEIGRFLYYDNYSERNAWTGQLRAELAPYAEELGDSQKALSRIKETITYRRYFGIKKYIDDLNRRYEKGSPEYKEYLELWNYIVPERYRHGTVEALLKDLEKRWYRFERKFFNVAGKICFDLYDESRHLRKEPYFEDE